MKTIAKQRNNQILYNYPIKEKAIEKRGNNYNSMLVIY